VTPTAARPAKAGERVTDRGPGRLIPSLSGASPAGHREIAQRPASEPNRRGTRNPTTRYAKTLAGSRRITTPPPHPSQRRTAWQPLKSPSK
jgi:hypothetical protein